MIRDWLKRSMPRGLYGRATLILVAPVVALQVVISIVFIQRHFEDVTRQLTGGVVLELRLILAEGPRDDGLRIAQRLRIRLRTEAVAPPGADSRRWYDLSGRVVIATLREGLRVVAAVDLRASNGEVRVWLDTVDGPVLAILSRQRVSASNPHQFLVLMATFGALMTGVAFVYLRNQLRPISELARASEAFGTGRRLLYRPTGATEVRAAGKAFLEMRARIERQIAQRTLMLSGVSHDLRTPLTRLKLELSFLPETPERAAMAADLDEMEALIDGFLDFARGAAGESPSPVAPADLAAEAVAQACRAGGAVRLHHVDTGAGAPVPLRRAAVARALGNLVGNAVRYAGRAEVSVGTGPGWVRLTVEDDGPGIAPERREEATEPFTRLDDARNQDRGSGVGLGLSIARDVAQSHGGRLELDTSARLGGLSATLVLSVAAADQPGPRPTSHCTA